MDSSLDVECKAIDSTGYLGCCYDKQRNGMIKGYSGAAKGKKVSISKAIYCEIINGRRDSHFNLLQFIGIQDDLRLNLLLKITKRVGIGAAANYPHPFDEYTRVLYYSYISHTEQALSERDLSRLLQSEDPQMKATHVIAGIDFGIDAVVILQLLCKKDRIDMIDRALHRLRQLLLSPNGRILSLSSAEQRLLETDIRLTAYSNIPTIAGFQRVTDVLSYINRKTGSDDHCQPMTYYLRPCKQLNSSYLPIRVIPSSLIKEIEQYLLQYRTPLQYLKPSLKNHTGLPLFGRFVDQLHNAAKDFGVLNKSYSDLVKRLADIMVEVRHGRCDASELQSMLSSDIFSSLRNSLTKLAQRVFGLSSEHHERDRSPRQVLQEQKPTTTAEHVSHQSNRRPPSSRVDQDSNNRDHPKSNDVIPFFLNREQNSLHSSSTRSHVPTSPGPSQKVVSPPDTLKYEKLPVSPSTDAVSRPFTPARPSPSSTDESINILLLGETGVGKSTFINAFVNYLSFDTFEQAETNQPVVLIPVSFIMTVGDNFDEKLVTFGDIDPSKNEDFDHPGQSVTQHCKSYIFRLRDQTKLCIIDTPGFGDTRGTDQDDENMQHILEYINNLTHLNAVCFLLKPNTSKLNIFFRSCLTQLFDLLGGNLSNNFTFCFTNARSTFYSPGDTAPLLKNVLRSMSFGDTLFKKENTFCFDNESFRYLVALRNDVLFKEETRVEYETSWATSVKESTRLVDYIRTKFNVHTLQGQWQSIKHAQFQIVRMARPMLETIRNLHRNIILSSKDQAYNFIELCPGNLHRPAFICDACEPDIIRTDNFWFVKDRPHELQASCLMCSCAVDRHTRLDYALTYKSIKSSTHYQRDRMPKVLKLLCSASTKLGSFLMHVACYTKGDPFESGLDRMIKEEKYLSEQQGQNPHNRQLSDELMKVRKEYREKIKEMKTSEERLPLPSIYEMTKSVCEYPVVQVQMDAIRQGLEIQMKQYENEHQEI